jgi:hypothetical protein
VSEELIVLSPLESAINQPIGATSSAQPLPDVPTTLDPVTALEQAVLPALQRPPCFVMFSGGRDSSLVLATAVHVARRDGLDLPIPTTDVFPGFPETDETEWQRLVLDDLSLTEHVRRRYGQEMSFLGGFVRESIRRHGLMAPAGVHLLEPTLKDARGGSVLVGHSGDGLFNGGSFARLRAVATRRSRATIRSPLMLARGLAPRPVRHAVAVRRLRGLPTWLRPEALEALKDLLAADDATEPLRWDDYVTWLARRRWVVCSGQVMNKLAATHGVSLVDPFRNASFLAAIARRGGALGWGSRTHLFGALFSELLPKPIISRETKAVFTRPYWGGDAREFVSSWDGRGVPTGIVDVDVLRSVWTQERPDARSALLLHAAFVASLGHGEVPDPFNCRFE